MIRVPFPHMALNGHNAKGAAGYQMWNTWNVPKSKSVKEIVEWVAEVARSASGGYLETLVINCHGRAGKISIGQGIRIYNVAEFNVLKKEGLVNRIWVKACEVARIEKAGTKTDGNYLCYRLAQESGAYVKASKNRQWISPDFPLIDEYPYGFVDDWEGTVYTWNPQGAIIKVVEN